MLRMMTYGGVNGSNAILNANRTPSNYCICKKHALEDGANRVPFDSGGRFEVWVDNRLVPVEAISELRYTITFVDYNDSLLGTETRDADANASVTPPSPTRSGYTLTRWLNTTTGITIPVGNNIPVNGNYTYKAVYTENAPTTYTMTWNPNGGTWADADGTGNKTTTPSAGSQIVAPGTNITKDLGWAFDGWYNQTLGRDYLVGDTADGNYTFTAKWIAAPVLRAAVTWQTDTDGGTNENHLVHGDPNNPYETNDWLYGSTPKIPLNIRFEPLYKDENGNEIGYGSQGDLNESTEPIGYCGGNPFYVDDIIWNASYAQNSTMNQQYSMSLVFRTYNGSVDGGPTITQPSKGYGLAITVETAHNNDSMLWRDEIPVTYTTRVRINENGTYNTYNTVYNYDGTVYSPTINAVVYSLQTLSDHGISSEPSPGTAITGPWIH